MSKPFSATAQALLSGAFVRPRNRLNYDMVEIQPSEQVREGAEELVAKGVLSKEEGQDGGFSYGLTEKGAGMDRNPPGETRAEQDAFMREHANFPLACAVEDDELAP